MQRFCRKSFPQGWSERRSCSARWFRAVPISARNPRSLRRRTRTRSRKDWPPSEQRSPQWATRLAGRQNRATATCALPGETGTTGGAGVAHGAGGGGPTGTIGATGTIGTTGGVIGRLVLRGQAASRLVPRIELLVIQPTPFCNIDCRYCYLPDRNSKAVVAPTTLFNLFSQVFASGWLQDCLSVVWHAGEPMVVPIRFYRDAFRMIDREKPDDLAITHSFQTNGTLIDDAWCDFFAREHVNVGVSIDGPKLLHDRNRLTRSGRGTFDRTVAGIRLLRERKIPFHVISVLSTASMAAAREMFDFYTEEGIERVCFNVEESEGDHVSECFAEGGIEAAYYRFLSEFWRLSAAAPGKIKFIREIEHAVQQVIRPKDASFNNQLVEPFAITSMDWAGNISTFSPELLGLKNAEYGDFLLGNINRDALVDLPARPAFIKMY